MDDRSTHGSLLGSAARGVGAGIGATLVMSGVMLGAQRLGIMHEQPPERIGGRFLAKVDPFHSPEERDAAGSILHVGIGAGLGALFAVLRRLVPGFTIPGAGIVYGLGVWAGSYAGILPALGLMPPPNRDAPGRQPTMIVAHLVFGAALGLLTRGIRRGGRLAVERIGS